MKLKEKKEIMLVNTHPENKRKSLKISGTSSGSGGGYSDDLLPRKAENEEPNVPNSAAKMEVKISKRNLQTIPTDESSDSSDSDENKISAISTVECTSPHEGRQLTHTILPINIDHLFKFLFSKSKFLLNFHESRKSTDINFDSEWTLNDENVRTRTVTMTVAIASAVGPKTTKVTEYQVMRDCCKEGELYSIDVTTVNAGIPYADSFVVLQHYCLVRSLEDHTMLSIHGQIKYKKSVWGVVKGFLERNIWDGLENFYSSQLRALQNEICTPPAKAKSRRSRREPLPAPEHIPVTAQNKIIEQTPNRSNNFHPVAEVAAVKIEQIYYQRIWSSVIVLLCILICLNGFLLHKLWRLEERIEEGYHLNGLIRFLAKSGQSESSQEWREQEFQHKNNLHSWHNALKTTIELLQKTEKSLKTVSQFSET